MNRPAFTVVEVVVVLTLVSVLASISVRSSHELVDRVRTARAVAEIRGLEQQIIAAEAKTGVLPASLAVAGAGPIVDPWGEPYVYQPLSGQGAQGSARKDRFMVPLNSDFDLYSKGADRETRSPLTVPVSRDDVIRASDGAYVGLAEDY